MYILTKHLLYWEENMSFIEEQQLNYIQGTPLAINFFSVSSEPAHFHSQAYELIYCLKGEITIVSSESECTLYPGDFRGINIDSVHYIKSNSDNLIASFHLNLTHPVIHTENLEHTLFRIEPQQLKTIKEPEYKELHGFLLAVLYLYINDTKHHSDIYNSICVYFVSNILKLFSLFNITNDIRRPVWVQERFNDIILYLYTHYDEKLTLKKISEMTHINYYYLSSHFNDICGDTFNDYITVLRIFKSEKMLLTTNASISSIVYACGFSSPKFYYAAFKSLYGMTPKEHRKRIAQHNEQSSPNKHFEVEEISNTILHCLSYHYSKVQLDKVDSSILKGYL